MCEFCDLMPKEDKNSTSSLLINSQTFGFFSAAAIAEAVQQFNDYPTNEDKKQEPGGSTDAVTNTDTDDDDSSSDGS